MTTLVANSFLPDMMARHRLQDTTSDGPARYIDIPSVIFAFDFISFLPEDIIHGLPRMNHESTLVCPSLVYRIDDPQPWRSNKSKILLLSTPYLVMGKLWNLDLLTP